jgi:hypothetical protein
MENYFVEKNSIVRLIWGKADTALFIFAGSAAEFALNKAVDWLYYTGKLPSDPLGRLFSTITYARQIIFSSETDALSAIDRITVIHKGVEKSRGSQIPDWAYRDVLFMLIDYSILSFELLDRRLTFSEKAEVFSVFYRVGLRMELTGLPSNYAEWVQMRQEHLEQNLIYSNFTNDLYRQYKKHLGLIRYGILKQIQLLLAPAKVVDLLPMDHFRWIIPFLGFYKLCRRLKIETYLRNSLLPNNYKMQILRLDKMA